MIWWLIKKYWKSIGLAISVLLLAGSMYFLYERSVSLEKDLTESELSLRASQKTVERLKQDRDAITQANTENARRQQEIQSELLTTQVELERLKQESVENEEKGSECLSRPIPQSIRERL